MSYDVSFKAKLEGVEQYVSVGCEWINHTSNTGDMIKDVCGSYPSKWNGKKCSEMLPVLEKGVEQLRSDPEKYRIFEPDNKWGTVESTIEFLDKIRSVCKEYPTAVINVNY